MMDSAASQLSAAIFALMCSLTARNHHGPGLASLFYHVNYARWGLEGTLSCAAVSNSQSLYFDALQSLHVQRETLTPDPKKRMLIFQRARWCCPVVGLSQSGREPAMLHPCVSILAEWFFVRVQALWHMCSSSRYSCRVICKPCRLSLHHKRCLYT